MTRRLVIFDRTQSWLTGAWWAGVLLYRRLERIDGAHGAASWGEALDWLLRHGSIAEVQFWGHGNPGLARFEREELDAGALSPGHVHHRRLVALRERLAPGALIWLRCCEAFGARRGMDFAERLADFFGVRVAGHTYIIGFNQSGLRGLSPGARADWSPDEGVGSRSHPFAPRTITCLHGAVPPGWLRQA